MVRPAEARAVFSLSEGNAIWLPVPAEVEHGTPTFPVGCSHDSFDHSGGVVVFSAQPKPLIDSNNSRRVKHIKDLIDVSHLNREEMEHVHNVISNNADCFFCTEIF